MASRNITLTLPDELIRRAKVLAAQRDMSVSALVGELLHSNLGLVAEYDAAWSAEEAVMDSGALRVGEIGWSRDQVHER